MQNGKVKGVLQQNRNVLSEFTVHDWTLMLSIK